MNSMPVELLPIARDDVNNALVYIAAEDPGAADRLLDELLAAMDQLSRFPLSAPEVSVGGRHPRRYYRVPVPPIRKYRTNGRHVWRCHFRHAHPANSLTCRQQACEICRRA